MKKQKTISKANVKALKTAIAKEQALIAILEEEQASQLQLEALMEKRIALHKKVHGEEAYARTHTLINDANVTATLGEMRLEKDIYQDKKCLKTKREPSEMEKAPETKPSQDIINEAEADRSRSSLFEPDRIKDQQDFCDMLSI